MRRAILLAVVFLLLTAGTLAAQRRGGGSPWGARPQHHVFVGSYPLYSHSLSYSRPFGNVFYGTPYLGYSYPGYGYYADPPRSDDRPTYVIAEAPAIPLEKQIVYVPTYMRSDPGPPLGDVARALRAKKQKQD